MQETPNNTQDRRASAWWMDRLGEKSTWNGAGLAAVCAMVLLGMPLIKLVAWIGLFYGIYLMISAG